MKKEYIVTNQDNIRMKLFYATIFALLVHVCGYFIMTQIKIGSSAFSEGSFWYLSVLRLLEFAGIMLYFYHFADNNPFNSIFCFIPSFIVHGRYFVGNIDNAMKTLNYYKDFERISGMKGTYSLKFYLSLYLPIVISLVTMILFVFYALYINGKMEKLEVIIYVSLGIIFAGAIIFALISLSSSLAYVPSVLEELFTRAITVCIMTVAFINLVPKKQIIDTIMASEEENKTYSSETSFETEEEEEDSKEADLKKEDAEKEEEKEDKAESEEKTEDTESNEDEEKSEDEEETKED